MQCQFLVLHLQWLLDNLIEKKPMMNVVIRNALSHLHTNKYLEKHCSVQATVNIKKGFLNKRTTDLIHSICVPFTGLHHIVIDCSEALKATQSIRSLIEEYAGCGKWFGWCFLHCLFFLLH